MATSPPSGSSPLLQISSPDGAGFSQTLAGLCSIGRHPDNTLQLGDREVSKEHAIVEVTTNGYNLRDLGSSNGTFLNGKRLVAQQLHLLKDGDEIRVGATKMIFQAPRRGHTQNAGVTVVAGARMLSNVLASVKEEDAGRFHPAAAIQTDEALRQDYEKLRVALEFQNQVGIESSAEIVLERLLKFAFETLKADSGAVLVKNLKGQLEVRLVRRHAGDTEEVAVSETVLARVMQSREAVLTADAVMDHRFVASKSIVAHGIRSAMAVPLIAKGEVLGVVFLATRERTGAFTDKDLKILAALGAQAAATMETAALRTQLQAEERRRENLARFLPPVLVDQVAKGEVKLGDGGELRQVTVLFADIRGFTSLAETQPPHAVVQMLKGYFELMAQSVFEQRGIVDKFIGDAVMALWGAPEALDDAPLRACRAALEMQHRLAVFNSRRASAKEPPIGVGIGINSGQAVVGLMGSTLRPEYTAIGDTVNVASRLCGLARAGQVLISGVTAKSVGRLVPVLALPDAQVKGRAQRVPVFEIDQDISETTLVR